MSPLPAPESIAEWASWLTAAVDDLRDARNFHIRCAYSYRNHGNEPLRGILIEDAQTGMSDCILMARRASRSLVKLLRLRSKLQTLAYDIEDESL